MASIDDLKNLSTPAPTGFKPGIEWTGDTGHVTVAAKPGEEPDRDKINGVIDSSPFLTSDEVEVDWSSKPRVSIHHDDNGNAIQIWYKLPLMRRRKGGKDVDDVLDLIYDDIPTLETDSDNWLTIQVGDTHIGKSALDGAGSDLLVKRWKQSIANALSLGEAKGVHIAFMGDLIEGENSQGGKNIANNDLTLTESLRVARHLVSWTVQEALLRFERVIVSTVPGNHAETTRLQNRPLTDSHDIDIVSAVQQAFELTEHKDRITWYYPEEGTGHLVYEVDGTIFASTHGHLFKGMLKGAESWWAGMSVSGAPAGAAHILMAAHYHSPMVSNYTRNKWICFGAALEDKSTWLNEQNGASSKPGMLAYFTNNGVPHGFAVV